MSGLELNPGESTKRLYELYDKEEEGHNDSPHPHNVLQESPCVPTKEVRVVNKDTGGEKGSKPEKYSLLPWDLLGEVAKLYAFGSKKYAPNNWRRGYDWSLSYDAMMRHSAQFWNGESVDEETGCGHLTSVIFHAFALMYFEQQHPDLDDRSSTTHG